MTDIPHFALPFRRSGPYAVVVEQDSPDDVVQCVRAIIDTPIGFRELAPDYGIRDQTFNENGVDIEEVATAVEQHEPRADAIFDRHLDTEDDLIEYLSIALGSDQDA